MAEKSSVDVVTFLTDDGRHDIEGSATLIERDSGLKIKFSQKAWHDADLPTRLQDADVVVTTKDGEHVHAVVDRKRRHLGHLNVHLEPTLLPTF